jgi:molybdate transport system permease protein
VEALDWGCTLHVAQQFAKPVEHVAIRAHHVHVLAERDSTQENSKNVFPCWLAAMTETPFRVTLDLRIGALPANAADFHLQAEVFKQEWEAFWDLPQPWEVEFAADRLFLLPD